MKYAAPISQNQKKKNAPNEKKLLEIREVGKKPMESPIHLA